MSVEVSGFPGLPLTVAMEVMLIPTFCGLRVVTLRSEVRPRKSLDRGMPKEE